MADDLVARLRKPCSNCNCEGCRDERSDAADEIERLRLRVKREELQVEALRRGGAKQIRALREKLDEAVRRLLDHFGRCVECGAFVEALRAIDGEEDDAG
jgi:hypothetical protein